MARYIIGRLPRTVLTFLGSVTLVFVVLQFAGDPVATLLPSQASSDDFARLRDELGLNRPVWERYVQMLAGIPSADFGTSFRLKQPAGTLVLDRMKATLALTAGALLVALVLAVPLGVLAARFTNGPVDLAVSSLAFLIFSIPSFWLGTMAIILFAVNLRWLPTSGMTSPQHFVLPVLTLAAWPLGQLIMLVRSEMLSTLGEDYIRTARAKGLREVRVLFEHALRNASISVLTLTGLILGQLLGGAIVTELVFAWPGVGRLAIGAIFDRDWPVVQASVIYGVGVFIVVNLVVDVLYGVLDPRIKVA